MKIAFSALMLFLLFSFNASTYESVFKDFEMEQDYYVIKVDDKIIYTDFGKEKGSFVGLPLNIYKQADVIKHPITGEVLGVTKKKICSGVVSQVYDKFSLIKANCKDVKIKDIVSNDTNLNVFLDIQPEVDDYFVRFVENDIRANNYKIVDNMNSAELIVEVKKLYRDEFSIIARVKNGNILISKVEKEKTDVMDTSQFKDRKKYDINKLLKSISVGDVDGDGKGDIVASSKNKVYIYNENGEQLEEKYSFGNFKNIINIEIADINSNGFSEIFVVDYGKTGDVHTHVYELKDNTYIDIAKLQYFVRGVISDGSAVIIGQKQHFEYLTRGEIFTLIYDNGEYRQGMLLDSPGNFKLYGFFSSGDKSLYINDNGFLQKSKGKTIVDSTSNSLGTYMNVFESYYGRTEGAKRKDLFHEKDDAVFKMRDSEKKVIFEFSPKSRFFKYGDDLFGFINTPVTSFVETSLAVRSSEVLQINIDNLLVKSVGGELSRDVVDMYMKRDSFGEYYFYMLESREGIISGGSSTLEVLKY